jgi:hypothetical protein
MSTSDDDQAGGTPTIPMPRQQWDQRRPGESDAAYARFLIYLALGTTRSVDRAYAAHRGAGKGKKSQPASGQWTNDAASFKWWERAEAWDVWWLQQVSDATQVAMTELACSLARRGVKLAQDDSKPNSFRGALEILKELAFLVPKKTIIEDNAPAGVEPSPDAVSPKIDARGKPA